MIRSFAVALLVSVSVCAAQPSRPPAQRAQPGQDRALARDVFRELIEINTSGSKGTNRAVLAIAHRLSQAGFTDKEMHILGPDSTKTNLVVRLKGSGQGKPLLFIAHLDVVAARAEDWSFDPFTFVERDGYFYGRGTTDCKAEAADLVVLLLNLKYQHVVPARDIIVALTADEETGNANGIDWLLKNRRDLIDAEYCINTDIGGGELRDGVPVAMEIQTSEKVYMSLQLETRNRGGHSSLPVPDNAIYRLARALVNISAFAFPVKLNETTQLFFSRMAPRETGSVAAAMRAIAASPGDAAAAETLAAHSAYYNAQMRTTAVATMVTAGHAENALPQTARAIVNCRMLPGESPDSVLNAIRRVINDTAVAVTRLADPKPSPLSPLRNDIVQLVERITAEMWPGALVLPVMSTGASDAVYLRRSGIPVYGVSGMFADIDDVRAHGRDERIGVREFYDGVRFMDRFVRALTSTP
jgi:acetylornithine deacetylase/succinyl-diaminopimelate desuccinylase-like protein